MQTIIKILKAISTYIIKTTIFLLIGLIPIIYIFQNITSKETIKELLSLTMKDQENISSNLGLPEDVQTYIDEEELENNYIEYYQHFIEVLLTKEKYESLSESKIKKQLEESIKQYQIDNNMEVNTQEIDEIFLEYDKEMEESYSSINIPNKFCKINKQLLSPNITQKLIILISILVLAYFLINREIPKLIKSLSSIITTHTIILGLLYYGINKFIDTNYKFLEIIKVLTKPLYKILSIYFIIAIILIILKIVCKKIELNNINQQKNSYI